MAKSAGDIKAGRAFVEIGANDSSLQKALKNAQKKLKEFGSALRAAGTKLMGVGAGIVAPLLASAKAYGESGAEIYDMSKKTGIAAESLSVLRYAAMQTGTSFDAVGVGVKKMQKLITDAGDGSSVAADDLRRLGLSYEQLAGLSPEKQFAAFADAISSVDDSTERAARAMAVFGRSGTDLLQMIEGGSEGLNRWYDQAQRLGIVMSGESAASATAFSDAVTDATTAVKGIFKAIGEAVAPELKSFAEWLTVVCAAVKKWVSEHKAAIVTALKIGAAIAALGAVLFVVGAAIGVVTAVIGTLVAIVSGAITAVTTIGAVIGALLSPIGLLVAALVGIGYAILKWTGVWDAAIGWIKKAFGELVDFVGEVAGGIMAALNSGNFELAGKILWLALRVVWLKGVVWLTSIWNEFTGFFLRVGVNAFYGIMRITESVVSGIQSAWTGFASFFARMWAGIVTTAEKRFADIKYLAQSAVDYKNQDKYKAEQSKSYQAADAEYADRMSYIEGEADKARKLRERRHNAVLEFIESERAKALNQIDDTNARRLSEAQAELDAALNALSEAIDKAKAKPDGIAPPGSGGRVAAIWGPGRKAIAPSVHAAANSVAGTFSGAALGQMAGGGYERVIADATKQTAKNTAAVANKIDALKQKVR